MTKEKSAREISLDILELILDKKEHSHKVLNMANEKYAYLKKEERAFLSRIVHGTLEYLLQIDYIISLYSKTKINKIKPFIRNLLRMSIYQIMYMDKVPDSAVCNEAVKLATKRGFFGLKAYVNGTLRTISREKEKFNFEDISIKYSIPQFIIDRIKASKENIDIEKVLKNFLEPSLLSIRINESKISIDEAIDILEKEGIEVHKSKLAINVLKIKGFDRLSDISLLNEKLAYVQDASSALAISVLDIKKDNVVFDVCAAPGGKSLAVLDKLVGTGKLYSFDLTDKKVDLLENNFLQFANFDNYEISKQDASVFNERYLEKADYIIADLPCSGFGIIGKKPDIKLNVSEESIESLISIQKAILNNIKRYLKPSGKLLFSTCTMNKAENEDNLHAFLEDNKDFVLKDFSDLVPASLKEEAKKGYIQLLAGEYDKDSDGFFISILERKA